MIAKARFAQELALGQHAVEVTLCVVPFTNPERHGLTKMRKHVDFAESHQHFDLDDERSAQFFFAADVLNTCTLPANIEEKCYIYAFIRRHAIRPPLTTPSAPSNRSTTRAGGEVMIGGALVGNVKLG